MYVLNEAVETGGNAFLTDAELNAKATEILGAHDIGAAIDALATSGRLVIEPATFLGQTEVAIYSPSLHTTERGLAERLQRLLSLPVKQPPTPPSSTSGCPHLWRSAACPCPTSSARPQRPLCCPAS